MLSLNWLLETCSKLSKMLCHVSEEMKKLPSNTIKERFCLSIFGLPGAHLARDQWLTTKKCLRKELLTGVEKLESLVLALIILRMQSLSMLRIKNGQVLSTITDMNLNAARFTVSKVFHMFSLSIPMEELSSKDTQQLEKILKLISILFLKENL